MEKDFTNIIVNSFCTLLFASLLFIIAEPAMTIAVQTNFTVSQIVSSEIAFATPASDITLAPSINSVLGGTATGGTQVVVKTNNRSGYSMTLAASSSLGMIGIASTTQYIPAYVTATAGVPDFAFNVPANTAYFGYTVEASTTADLATPFKDSLGSCNSASGGDTANSCWIPATSTAYTIINRTSETEVSGATTTLKFQVVISANPSPAIPNDTYVATTTLTATTN